MPAATIDPRPLDRSGTRTTALVVLAAVMALAFVVRIPSIAEPLGIDQGLLSSGARALARGQMLYRDVWDQKPPAIFLTYLGAFTLFGWTPASVAWLDILASATTALLLVGIVRPLGGLMMAALAGALYAALTVPSWLYRYNGFLERSVAETFITLCVAFGAWCAVRLARGRSPRLMALGLGLGAGIAASFKPNAGIYLPALLAWAVVFGATSGPPRAPASLVRRARDLGQVFLAAAFGALIVPALTLAWLWGHGVLPEARVALLGFNRFYVAENFSLRSFGVDFSKAVWLRMKSDPLWAAGSLGAAAGLWDLVRRRRIDPMAALAIAWGGAAAVVIFVNGVRLFNTYFIQALAPLAVLASWLLAAAADRSPAHKLLAATAVVLLVVLPARKNYPGKVYQAAKIDLDQLLTGADRTAYLDRFGGYGTGRGYSALANDELAAYVRAHTTPHDLIYQFGINSAGLYFAADRPMAQRFLRVNEFVPSDFPAPGFDLASVTRELDGRKPVYLVFEELHTGTRMADAVDHLQQAPDVQHLLQAYRLETRIEDFTVYRRK